MDGKINTYFVSFIDSLGCSSCVRTFGDVRRWVVLGRAGLGWAGAVGVGSVALQATGYRLQATVLVHRIFGILRVGGKTVGMEGWKGRG
jgi:hypothetical protein